MQVLCFSILRKFYPHPNPIPISPQPKLACIVGLRCLVLCSSVQFSSVRFSSVQSGSVRIRCCAAQISCLLDRPFVIFEQLSLYPCLPPALSCLSPSLSIYNIQCVCDCKWEPPAACRLLLLPQFVAANHCRLLCANIYGKVRRGLS